MSRTTHIKAGHKAVHQYHAGLQSYADQHVEHEGALETAFQRLLADTARDVKGWTLIPKLSMKVGGKTIAPDGTLRDEYNLPRGYWEAKDTHDHLDAEIQKKIQKGYPLRNIIFEDTRLAVLFQSGREVARFDLTNPQKVADLLNDFFAYTEPDIQGFEQAVQEFKERVPDLAKGLDAKIKLAHKENRRFQTAFDDFFAMCQTALNPNLSRDAVDEMLVQHLLTERLFRKIFDNQEFTRRNVIAAEVEKVIDALVSQSFNRDDFLRSLDRFYRAIEEAAHTLADFTEKQHFLNTVYERFFQGYSVKTADTHGIVYTPQAIVDFMCASVAEVLEAEFGLPLGSPGVNILDPCTGTGNFIVNLLHRIPKKDLPRVYREQLFANEVMLLPYYIAAMNIEHAYWELTGQYEGFEGMCFVDTLDLADEAAKNLFAEANTARVERQKRAPITVIVGNPPYNANQLREDENNKNRAYPIIDKQIKGTYAKASKATLKNKLYDPYVKFIRWATNRLRGKDGIVCLVTNNSFVVDRPPFDGMRKHLWDDFTAIYHLDLGGSVKKNQKLSGTKHNVFGIQLGVGITVAVRSGRHKGRGLYYHALAEGWRRETKCEWLEDKKDIRKVEWTRLTPDQDNNWLPTAHAADYLAQMPLGGDHQDAVFRKHSTGAKSNRDEVVYDFSAAELHARVPQFIEDYNSEVDRFKRSGLKDPSEAFFEGSKVIWSSTLKLRLRRGTYAKYDQGRVRECLYRPFTKQFLYYDETLNDRPGLFRYVLPTSQQEQENVILCTTGHSQMPFCPQMTSRIANEAVGGRAGHCFPYYVYDKDGTNRRENITDWSLNQFRTHYGDDAISKWDVFHYVYGLLHHPGYRTKFADNLKRDLPRIPFAPDFRAFAAAGKELARLHLDYEKLDPYPLKWVETDGVPLSYKVEDKMRLNKDKTALRVNPSLTLAGIPPETFSYRLGNRSALEWVIDQYQVTEDKRSGVRSDPNRADDPEYIVRLVGQVVRVSVDTVKIVAGLPERYAE